MLPAGACLGLDQFKSRHRGMKKQHLKAKRVLFHSPAFEKRDQPLFQANAPTGNFF